MRRLALLAAAGLAALGSAAAELTPLEQRWLQGGSPVIGFARRIGLPLDVVVQPQDEPDAAPLALGFDDGRCKLVLSLRGNPQGQATLAALAPPLHDAVLELMAAHEMAHCRRYVQGAWHGLPAGFSAPLGPAERLSEDDRAAYLEMQATRREEAYADLVGLAWVQLRHPALYPQVHAWLSAERARDALPGSHHDTAAWLQHAAGGLPGLEGPAGLFDAAERLWRLGLEAQPR